MAELICLQHISKIYNKGKNEVRALDDISLSIPAGRFVAITGASGSGKSTLMHILGCLDTPDHGSYFLAGADMRKQSSYTLSRIRRQKIGFVFQRFHLIPTLTARENVQLPLVYAGIPERRRTAPAEQALRLVGLDQRMDHRPNQLSGGQQQRVAIARALINDPPVLLADEPTGNLDSNTGEQILDILQQLHRRGKTIILITHDPRVADAAETRVLLQDGKIV